MDNGNHILTFNIIFESWLSKVTLNFFLFNQCLIMDTSGNLLILILANKIQCSCLRISHVKTLK